MKSFDEYKLRVGRAIHKRRTALGLSLRDFGLMAGVHYNQLNRIERGLANPSLETLYKIADALDIDISNLLA